MFDYKYIVLLITDTNNDSPCVTPYGWQPIIMTPESFAARGKLEFDNGNPVPYEFTYVNNSTISIDYYGGMEGVRFVMLLLK